VRVLRIEEQESFILFDPAQHIRLEVTSIKKNSIETTIITRNANIKLTPEIQVLLPILKREAFQEAIYSCIELGANKIWLINTQKSQRLRDIKKDLERLHKIAVSAAEQSKCFAFADIQAPLDLHEVLELFDYRNVNAFFCDPQGERFSISKSSFAAKGSLLAIGPEGDLTAQEKTLLSQYSFTFISLTPTVLRAQQAVTVGLGLLRSLVISK
jgi:16S rRNA (uracil1498-N3)-methyltransferase